jgi:hypothetical protein
MARLLVHVEGETEEEFVTNVLRDHLLANGYSGVSQRILGKPGQQGIGPWPSARRDIIAHLKEDPTCVMTTMVDYYGLPKSGGRAWPGRAEAGARQGTAKAELVEKAILDEIATKIGSGFHPRRFVPHVVLHEFEGLLFSDCAAFSRAIYRPDLETALRQIREQFPTPEDINDSPDTAPSKRVNVLMGGRYEKPLLGTLAALEIGLDRIRQECPHFDGWLTRLEAVAY